MEDHDKSYGLIQVENLLLRSKLESHEATFRQLQNELKTVQEEVLSHSSDSGASIPEDVELSKHLQTIEKLEQELQEMKDLDAKVKAKYLEDLDQLRVENLLLTQKLSSMQDSYEEMKFTVVKMYAGTGPFILVSLPVCSFIPSFHCCVYQTSHAITVCSVDIRSSF